MGNRFFNGEVSGILMFVKSNNRAYLESLLKIRASVAFTSTQIQILYGLVVDAGRQLNIKKM